jgi:hypothetical protein
VSDKEIALDALERIRSGEWNDQEVIDAIKHADDLLGRIEAPLRSRIAELEARIQQLLTAPHKLCYEDRWKAGYLSGRASVTEKDE